jgi:hypothetical protein
MKNKCYLEVSKLSSEQKRLNHPLIAYLIGLIVIAVALTVLLGVLHHLTISHHGPQLLKPILNKFLEKNQSTILDEVKSQEEFEEHNHFHHIVKYPELPEGKRPVCFICHSALPHAKNKKIRALMNMHTQYLVCETCHIKERPGTKIVYKWYSPLEDNPRGPFFGTGYNSEKNTLITGDPYSKIAPFFEADLSGQASSVKADNLLSAIQMQDAPVALDFMKVRDKLSPEQRDGVKSKFHQNIKPKGYDCKTCHTGKSILDFKKLGFSEKRTSDLTTLEIVGVITKYEEFYLPEILK